MKILFILFVILFVSCNDHKEIRDDEDLLSDDDISDEETLDDDSEQIPVCIEEWNEMEIIEDISGLFNFEIIKKTDKWGWEKDGEFEKMDSPADCYPQHVMKDGTIISSCSGANTSDGIEYLNILKKDGTLERFFIKPEKVMKFEFIEGYYIPFLSNIYYDDSTNEIVTFFSMKSEESGNPVKGFVQKMSSDGKFSYFSWKMKNNTACSATFRHGSATVFLCQKWEDDSSIRNPGMIVFVDGRIYEKTFDSDLSLIPTTGGFNGSEFFSYYSYQDSGFTYSFDIKDFCVKEMDRDEHFLTDYFRIKSNFNPMYFARYNSDSVLGGYTENLFQDEAGLWGSIGLSVYVNKGASEKIYSIIKKEKPEDHPYAAVSGILSYKEPGMVFFTGGSDFDVEDLDRFEYSQEEAENDPYPFQPFLMAIDLNSDKVYVRQMLSESRNNFPGAVVAIGEDLYYQKMEIGENNNVTSSLLKIPISWIINEDALAKEKYLTVEEKKTLKDIGKVLTVSCGRSHTCVLNENDQPICWGDNSNGQLGDTVGIISKDDPLKITSPYPDLIEMDGNLSGKKVTGVDTFSKHTCAVTDAGVLYCWGDDSFETIGAPTPGNNFTYYPLPVKTDGVLKDKKIADVAPGASHTCAVDENGKGYCWGQNLLGSAGCGLEDQIIHEPVEVDMTGALKDKKILEISSGSGHTCTVADDGGIYCWGSNDTGQLGDGNGGHGGGIGELGDLSRVPVKSETGELKFKTVSSGASHTCALSEDGEIYCFGNNSKGQLGDSTTEMRLIPVKVDSDKVFKSVSAGFEHSCAVDEAGDAYCWGSNITGQLGNGTKEDSFTPVKVAFDEVIKIKSVSCGHRHTCALDDGGKVYCWGWNNSGQLGNGTYDDSNLPVEIRVKE